MEEILVNICIQSIVTGCMLTLAYISTDPIMKMFYPVSLGQKITILLMKTFFVIALISFYIGITYALWFR